MTKGWQTILINMLIQICTIANLHQRILTSLAFKDVQWKMKVTT
jgi:hypothetical protein